MRKRALPAIAAGAVAVAPLFSEMFSGGSFIYGISSGKERIVELSSINKKMVKLQQSVEQLNDRVKSLEVGQQWIEGATLYGNDVQRLRFLLHKMQTEVVYCESAGNLVLKTTAKAKEWADSVLDSGPDGLEQILFNIHDLVMGTGQLFGRRSLIAIYKDTLTTPSELNPGNFTTEIEDFVLFIMALETGGYAAISTAMNIKEKTNNAASNFVENKATPRMEAQWAKIFEIVGTPSSWREISPMTPPFHIAADDIADTGARFVDLDGDGRMDLVYHRWRIGENLPQKGAYINKGNTWAWAPQYIPPFPIAADDIGDTGARFVDLNGDGKIDLAYHKWRMHGNSSQKGAYLNNGNGWTWAPQYIPPFPIAADDIGDTGARFVDLNGDGRVDLAYHRWRMHGNSPQKGAYLNNGNDWTWAPQYIPPFPIAADDIGDTGARFVDLNGDGRVDLAYHRWRMHGNSPQKGAYLNNGNGWTWASRYVPPFPIAADDIGDTGARFVDLNGDGRVDLAYHRWRMHGNSPQKGAYLNNGYGWKKSSRYTPPFPMAADDIGDTGARFVDLNGDGRVDLAYNRWRMNGNPRQKGAFLNNGRGWSWAPQYIPPVSIAADDIGDAGSRFVDLNGNGKMDLVYYRWMKTQEEQKGAYQVLGFMGDHTKPFFADADFAMDKC